MTREDYDRENAKLDVLLHDSIEGNWKPQWEKVRKISLQLRADSRIKAISSGVKMDVEKYKAYYDEYMRRGEPDAIEKIDLPKQALFVDVAQKEIIEKAISEPTKLFKLTAAEEKSYNAALEQTGADSLSYIAALPFALGTSILTGKPQKMWLSPSSAIKIAQDINAQELANVLRIDNPVPVTAREAIEPSEGKSDKVLTTLFGKQGGLYFNYDTKTKQLYIESRKTLRTTSGGEKVTDFYSGEPPINPKTGEPFPDMYAQQTDLGSVLFTLPALTGTGSRFTDIPIPTTDKIKEISANLIAKGLFTPLKGFWTTKGEATEILKNKNLGTGKKVSAIWDLLTGKSKGNKFDFSPDAPRFEYTLPGEPLDGTGKTKMVNDYDLMIMGLRNDFDENTLASMAVEFGINLIDTSMNAIVANMVAIRKILTDLGIPASDIEKFGGAYGMTYSSTPVNYDDLPDDVKAVIDAATGTGIEEPKKDDQGTFDKDGNYYPPGFNPDDLIKTSEIDLGSAGEVGGVDATAAATAAAEKDKKKNKNKNKNESTLYKKVIGKTLLKT